MNTSHRQRFGLDFVKESSQEKFENVKKWEWTFLREKCKELELEGLYKAYMEKRRISYIPFFLILFGGAICCHIMLLIYMTYEISEVLFEIYVYILVAVLVSFILIVNVYDIIRTNVPILTHITSWLAISLLMLPDILIPYHEYNLHGIKLSTAYEAGILLTVYIILPFSTYIEVICAGIYVSVSYLIIYKFIAVRRHWKFIKDRFNISYLLAGTQHNVPVVEGLVNEFFFYLCLNLLGLFFRLMQEQRIRSVFLNRREIAEETVRLRTAIKTQRALLKTVIPEKLVDTIARDVKTRVEEFMSSNMPDSYLYFWRTRKLFIEYHEDVSILFADVVNYTYLTTQLNVNTLVDTLHEVYAAFDKAALELDVVRIKFLGDCYYCVGGITENKKEGHAKNTVELGLRMINAIREIRAQRNLDVDMRIGVHSGNVVSGIVGATKWQYDVWSKDCDIANRLEQTGVAGRVHISQETLKQLDLSFEYEDGTETAKNDAILKMFRINTYLIVSTYVSRASTDSKQLRIVNFQEGHRISQISNDSGDSELDVPLFTQVFSRKDHVSSSSLLTMMESYNELRRTSFGETYADINEELRNMPVITFYQGKNFRYRTRSKTSYEDNNDVHDDTQEMKFIRAQISSWFLYFKNWHWERLYLFEPDVFLKYNVLMVFLTFNLLFLIQILYKDGSRTVYLANIICSSILLIILIIVWYKKLWLILQSNTKNLLPKNNFSFLLYVLSDYLQKSFFARVAIYSIAVGMHFCITVLTLDACSEDNFQYRAIDSVTYRIGVTSQLCLNPWTITQGILVTICIIFLFSHISFVLKIIVASCASLYYVSFICIEYDQVFNRGTPTNGSIYVEYSHAVILLVLLAFLYATERQTALEYRVDYCLRRELYKKKFNSSVTKETIMVLVRNTLPIHVAEIFMFHPETAHLYSEEYDDVAVMFATVKNIDTNKAGIRFLNELMSEFDCVLQFYEYPLRVEKIKVIGWTYMACCGLNNPTLTDTSRRPHSSKILMSDLIHNIETLSTYGSYEESSYIPPPDIIRGAAGATRPSYTYRSSSYTQHGSILLHPTSFTDSDANIITNQKSSRRPTAVQWADSLTLDNDNNENEVDEQPGPSKRNNQISDSDPLRNVVYVMTIFALDLMRSMYSFNMIDLDYGDRDDEAIFGGKLRIGIANGKIMAGVVGFSKPHFDIWGNAVNMASRMDSTGEIGKIQITEETADILKKFNVNCISRGDTYVKGRGYIPTYFVDIDENYDLVRHKTSMN